MTSQPSSVMKGWRTALSGAIVSETLPGSGRESPGKQATASAAVDPIARMAVHAAVAFLIRTLLRCRDWG